nr:hypothetical protein [Rhodospirillales bacterium]
MSIFRTFTSLAVTGAMIAGISAFLVGSAFAQKSKDTVRFGLYQPIKILDRIYNPHPETNLTAPAVFDMLLFYD